MAINVNPQGASGGNVRKTGARTAGQASQNARESFAPPPERAHVNFIPAVESLATMIESAVAALRKGVYWDRGTILNLVV